MDGGKWERAYHDYDAAGRLVRRSGGSDGATGYTLDAEGRVTAIANNSYSETLSFAANGLVAEKTTSVAYGGEKFVQRMEYDYGDRRFLTAAICGESNLSPFTELFSETFDYDLNGNVTMINRGYPAVQEAAIEYEGNRVSRIVDSSSPAMAVYAPRFAEGEYDRPIVYDQCGRITADRTRRIASILYNDRHLPIRFTMDNGNTLSLSYNADGVKERETETSYYVTTVTRVENGDTVVREQKRARSTLREYYGDVLRVGGRTRRLEWSGGFFSKDDNGRWHSHRYVRNSLGSIVAVTDSAGTVEQAVCYYASGLPVYKAPNNIPATRRMHVDKEFEQFESIDWYDNEARFYDPLLVRFTTPDPLALSYPSVSPYAYCANNPVNVIDTNGNDYKLVYDEGNRTITVSAQYYTTESYADGLSKALNFWNGQSGKFKIEGYIINFDLSVVIVTPFSGRSDHNTIFNMRRQIQENTYEESLEIKFNEYGEHIAGVARDGRFITKYINFADEKTVPHEIGHTLGLMHLDGTIMDPNRDAVMPIVTPEQVESIINNSNTNKDAGKRIETEQDWRD